MELKIPKELKGKELSAYLVEKMDNLTDSICQEPQELEKFVKLWDSSLGMHTYSINNTILAWCQYPQVSMLAGFRKWQKLGRTVNKGERAIKVLAPLTRKIKDKENDEEAYIISGFRYVNVFDVNQTEGENLDFGHSDKVKGDISFDDVKKISPLPVIVEYSGVSNGNVTPERILVAPKDNEAAMVATLIHEIAHLKLGHLGSDFDKETKEVEAETVSFIVCSYLNLDNQKSQYYVGAWNGNHEKLQGRGKRIISTAESIIRDIQSLS
jgi:antirestriction protein ArdC